MRNVTVIACIYNSLEVARRSIGAAIQLQQNVLTFILINNHSIDLRVQDWLAELDGKEINGAKIVVIDPHTNLGCHNGFNFGMQFVSTEYVVKLDDDTVVQTLGWDRRMVSGLSICQDIAYVSADIDAKQKNDYKILKAGIVKYEDAEFELIYEIAETGIIGFSMVMFRYADLARWGDWVGSRDLYGGEEQEIAHKARAEGLQTAHFPPVFAHHEGNEERHPEYPQWKWLYGYKGWVKVSMEEWLKNPSNVLDSYRDRWLEELRGTPVHEGFAEYVAQRIAALGTLFDVALLNHPMTQNANVKEHPKYKRIKDAIDSAIATLTERHR